MSDVHAESAVQLLQQTLGGDSAAADQLYRSSRAYLLSRIRRLAPYLAPDLWEDVLDEAWVCIRTSSSEAFQSHLGHTVPTFFHYQLRNAIKKVRASYCPPGQPTRPQKDERGEWAPRLPALTLDESTANVQPILIETSLDEGLDAQHIVDVAPELLKPAIELIFFGGYTHLQASRELGLKRQTMSLHLKAYFHRVRPWFSVK